MQQVTEVDDVLAIMRRRKAVILVPFVIVLAAVVSIAYSLPALYLATAQITIDQQDIPSDLVETTVRGYVQERLAVVTQRVTSRENLWKIIEEVGLFPDQRAPELQDELISQMRTAIATEMEVVDTVNPSSGRDTRVTVAFSVSYTDSDPAAAQQVANRIAQLYLEENQKYRKQQTANVLAFITTEMKRRGDELAEVERKLADFKKEHANELPEMADATRRLAEQAEFRIAQASEQLVELEERRGKYQADLAATPKYLPASGGDPSLLDPSAQLALMRAELAEAQLRYSDKHPDIKRLKADIAGLVEGIRSGEFSGGYSAPANPAYVAISSQLSSLDARIQALNSAQRQYEDRLHTYEMRLLNSAVVEKDYDVLLREKEHAESRFNEIKAKRADAELAEQLEQEQKAERFRLARWAAEPTSPESPNRPGIALLGVVLAMGSGLGAATLAEYFDKSIYGAKGVMRVLNAPPIGTIPYISTATEIAQRRQRRHLGFLIAAVVLGVILALVHFFVMPIDELWTLLLEQLGVVEATEVVEE